MGQEIVYCFSCQTRLMAVDFERGKAVRFEDRVSCTSCARGYLATLPPDKRPKPAVRVPESSLASVTPRRANRIPSGATPQPGGLPPVPVESAKKPLNCSIWTQALLSGMTSPILLNR